MSFTNLYYKRTAATAKACYVCYKPTTTVLATSNTVDFLYTCPGHLADAGFASLLPETSDNASGVRKAELSAEEIAKVKEEWEEKQKKKKEKEKEKAKEKDEAKDEDEKKAKEKRVETKTSPPPSTPTPPTHQRYSLHRDYYAMRQLEHRKRKQAAQTKALAPQLPSAPRGSVTDTF